MSARATLRRVPRQCRRATSRRTISSALPNAYASAVAIAIAAKADQLRLEASPTRRAMTMAGNRTPRVDRKVASILAGVFTA
jgi:hypothetical protein